MIYIKTRKITSSSFQAKAYDLETTASDGSHYIIWYLDGNRWSSEDLASDDTTSSWVTFDGLDPETEYEVTIQNIGYGGTVLEEASEYCTTEAAEAATEWTVTETDDLGYIESESSNSYYLDEYEVVRIKVGFQTAGTATFYSEGASSSRGYLSESTSFDSSSGKPSSYLEYDSNTSGDFSFTCDVESGTYYYLFVRHRYDDEAGNIDVHIVPPGGTTITEYWTIAYENGYNNLDSTLELDYDLSQGEVVRIRVSFTESGTAEFYSVGSDDTIGYLSDKDSEYFDTVSGEPGNILASNDDGGTGSNFKITYEVEAGVYYYLYVRHYNSETACTPTVCIVPPSGSSSFDGAYILMEGNTGTTLTVSITGLDPSYSRNDRYIYWSVDGTEKGSVSLGAGASQSASYTFSGLSPSTSYSIGARITYTSNGTTLEKSLDDLTCSTANWASRQETGFGTVSSEKSASWTLQKATVSYASVTFSKSGNFTISSSGSYDTCGYLTTGTPSFDNSTGIPNSYLSYNDDGGTNSNFSITYAVEAGITYYIWARGYSTSTSVGTIEINISFSGRPALFTWADGSTTKVSGKAFDITASEWCALLDNINAVRVYKGYAEIGTGTTVAYFTYPVSGDKFTAVHYNQALNGMTGILGSGYNDNAVSSGDKITAAKINFLVDRINGIE